MCKLFINLSHSIPSVLTCISNFCDTKDKKETEWIAQRIFRSLGMKLWNQRCVTFSDDRICFESPAGSEFWRNFKKPLFFSRSNVSRANLRMRTRQTVGGEMASFCLLIFTKQEKLGKYVWTRDLIHVLAAAFQSDKDNDPSDFKCSQFGPF